MPFSARLLIIYYDVITLYYDIIDMISGKIVDHIMKLISSVFN